MAIGSSPVAGSLKSLMNSNEPVMSVIIPCRNHAAELSRCLSTVLAQELADAFEVIVVDSAADERVAAVVSQHVTARIVRSPDPLLPGQARNLGAAQARGIYLAFID